MKPEDAKVILASLAAAGMRYAPKVDATTEGVWAQNLRDITADDGLEAVRRIVSMDEDFPTLARVAAIARGVRREREERGRPNQGAGYRCRKCDDVKMVEVGHDTWRPCQHCNPDAFARWEMGDYATKVFRPVLDPIDVDGARVELAGVREVLANAQREPGRRAA